MPVQQIVKDRMEEIANRKGGGPVRLREPVIIKGILFTEQRRVPAKDLLNLKIDATYQRERVDSISGDLAEVLRRGGQIPCPVHLVKRKNGDLYIVDGQQRWWAHLDAEKDMTALVHTVDSYETERDMFVALNLQVRVLPGLVIKAWSGPSAETLRRVNADEDHALYHRISFGLTAERQVIRPLFRAASLLVGMAAAAGTTYSGATTRLLQQVDSKMGTGQARARVEEFLNLVAGVFPASASNRMLILSLGLVAHERWGAAPAPVSDRTLSALRRLPWDTVVPAFTDKFRPVVLEEIRKRWS